MKTIKLITHIMMMVAVLAAVTACAGKKGDSASFRGNRGTRSGYGTNSNVPSNSVATTGSTYGIITGYGQDTIYNFLGGDSSSIGNVMQTGSTDSGVYIVGRLIYNNSSGQLNSNSSVQIIVRDQGYQNYGGEFQSNFGNCQDQSYSGTQIMITCYDNAGTLTINGSLSSTNLYNATLSAQVSFTTNGYNSGYLGQFQMRANAIIGVQ